MSYILSFIAGAIFWTLAEYLLHRFLGHSLHIVKLKTKFYKEHAKHHFIKNYYASATDKLLSCVAFGPLVFVGAFFIIGPMNAFIFTGGFLSMYMVYEIIHYRLHAVAPTHFFAAKMRAHHFFHHYGDPLKNHGVTSFFWDYVFGTYVKDSHIKIPIKYTLRWLPISKTGQTCEDGFGYEYSLKASNDGTLADFK
jgi:sterol desaturase/sphingolipid hydroxylase (fatty acid hydroxylase superfamily)